MTSGQESQGIVLCKLEGWDTIISTDKYLKYIRELIRDSLLKSYGPLEELLLLPNRKLIVSSTDIDLTKLDCGVIFVLIVEESFGSAGGRAGGSGSRKISRILGFRIQESKILQIADVQERGRIDLFEIPYSAVALDVKFSNGQEEVVQGIVDPVLVESYMRIINTIG